MQPKERTPDQTPPMKTLKSIVVPLRTPLGGSF
jgi:hypothetical protein